MLLTFDESGLRILLDASAEVAKMDAPEVDKMDAPEVAKMDSTAEVAKMDAPEVAKMDAHSKCIRIERCNKPMLGHRFPLMEVYMLTNHPIR